MIQFTPYEMQFKSEITLFQNQYKCQVNENEFNYSQNPTVKSNDYGEINPDLLREDFDPYATTIGLYNNSNELILVGKIHTPVRIPKNNDVTFIIRYDS